MTIRPILLTLAVAVLPAAAQEAVVDAASLNGKWMCGYQRGHRLYLHVRRD